MRFSRAGDICVEPLDIDVNVMRTLNQNLMLFFTNITRKAENVLLEQVENMDARLAVLEQMKELALCARDGLRRKQVDDFGELLHQGWLMKRQLASRISNPAIDASYDAARAAGALGGKITGAGGGGFLLLYCPAEHQTAVRNALSHLPELPFRFERDGSKVIFNYRR